MSITKISNKRGFIALITIIILGFVLVITVLTLGSKSIGNRFALLDFEKKDASVQLAKACIEVARVAIVNDPNYLVSIASPVTVTVGSGECEIHEVTDSGGWKIVHATGESGGAVTNLEFVIDKSSGATISYREMAHF